MKKTKTKATRAASLATSGLLPMWCTTITPAPSSSLSLVGGGWILLRKAWAQAYVIRSRSSDTSPHTYTHTHPFLPPKKTGRPTHPPATG